MDVSQAIVVVSVIAVFVCFFSIGYSTGISAEQQKWEEELIERGLARYHPKTGEWEWIEQEADGK